MTSTPVAVKSSAEVTTRTIRRRNSFLRQQLLSSSGSSEESMIIQTGKLVKSFTAEYREKILKKANIEPVSIGPNN